MKKSFERPYLTATSMGGVPYRDLERTVQTILDYFPVAPCLPVTTRSARWMFEGIPCLRVDREKRKIYMDPSAEREEELIEFYDRYEQGDLDYFATTPQAAPFFYAMLERLKESPPPDLKWVSFHTAGPVLLGDIIVQVDGRPSFNNETLRDVIKKVANMKTKWLEKKIKEEIPGVEVLADLPETTLVNFTSAGGTGTRDEIIKAINEGFQGLTCPTWIHCCANIDWSLLTETNVDVINFDAYQHSENMALYSKELQKFLGRGGMIAWGIVPVIEDLLLKESVPSLVERLEKGIKLFVSQGIDEELLVSSSWILSSCETILLTQEQSDLVFGMIKEISQIMRKRYGFDA